MPKTNKTHVLFVSVCLLLVVSVLLGLSYGDDFCPYLISTTATGEMPYGRTLDCTSCHFGGSDMDLNPYGIQYEVNRGLDLYGFENFDADGDGQANISEIEAHTNPGNFTDATQNNTSRTNCVSFFVGKLSNGNSINYCVSKGNKTTITNPCYINDDGKSMAPLRVATEQLGGEAVWIAADRRIDIKKNSAITAKIWLDNQYAQVNGNLYDMGTTPEIKNGTTFIPLRAIGDALGAKLEWVPHGKIANFIIW
ncbi:MAG TPA: copper amine oxidase N-terminal domain-containing protein [Caldisericia bacterium]|nr:copper amine oxidase N-terminal domain-containing protein [Caldisericia bacterium]HPF48280.1 copper amine oxidase N-terminal domain-containing protein [Caldisericia bacterium]HPI83541.1 copper amine oxidase N-terminal domain-containing protein [Caldisericia bacterium]HPQ92733.1 copper amine oxidase N-terminal domain-containing protein [Caldisericia bacterium]HRV74169.1 copper amine oxidase N-terminal domain-containing protein [Caldisericia bacterium]